MAQALEDSALAQLFLDARTHSHWLPDVPPDSLLQQVYALARMGPCAANCSPARIVFVRSAAAKARLLPALDAGNRAKTQAAPVTAIIAYDLRFYEQLDTLFPHAPARSWFEGNDAAIRLTALRNGSLQGAYLMLAARALGLDCGPMGGFNAEEVDAAFFADSAWRSNFLCNLGYGDASRLHPRLPRLPFATACRIE